MWLVQDSTTRQSSRSHVTLSHPTARTALSAWLVPWSGRIAVAFNRHRGPWQDGGHFGKFVGPSSHITLVENPKPDARQKVLNYGGVCLLPYFDWTGACFDTALWLYNCIFFPFVFVLRKLIGSRGWTW
jgi:hypothetical protein